MSEINANIVNDFISDKLDISYIQNNESLCLSYINEDIRVKKKLIKSTTIKGELILDKDFTYDGFVEFNDVTFEGKVTFSGTFNQHIVFNRCSFEYGVFDINIDARKLSLINTKSSLIKICGDITKVEMSGGEIKHINFLYGHFFSINLHTKNTDKLSINNLSYIHNCSLTIEDTNLIISGSNINLLKIAGANSVNNRVNIEDVSLNSLYLQFHNSGTFEIRNLQVIDSETSLGQIWTKQFIQFIYIDSIQGIKTLFKTFNLEEHPHKNLMESSKEFKEDPDLDNTFNKISEKLKNEFSLYRTVLGRFSMHDTKLENFHAIVIVDVDLSGILLYRTTFPKHIKDNVQNLYEIYNALYIASKNQNNKKDELFYYKCSRNALLRLVKEENKKFSGSLVSLKFKKLFKKEIGSLRSLKWRKLFQGMDGTLISLQVSKTFSDYGTNFLKTIPVTIILVLIPFVFILNVGYYPDFSDAGIQNFKKIFGKFFAFLNPTHELDFIYSEDSSFIQNLCFIISDFIGRIIIGLGIFEIIQSFRKYVKK